MNTLWAVIIGALTVYLVYTLYARRIDRHVIQSDPKRKPPATLYMDGADFMANVMESQPRTHLGIILLTVMGLLLGQMLYRWRIGLVGATALTVGVTLAGILAGPWTEEIFKGFNAGLNSLTGGAPLVTYFDP